MDIKAGEIFKGNRSGRQIKILKVDENEVTYKELEYGTVFTVGRKMFEHLAITKVETL